MHLVVDPMAVRCIDHEISRGGTFDTCLLYLVVQVLTQASVQLYEYEAVQRDTHVVCSCNLPGTSYLPVLIRSPVARL